MENLLTPEELKKLEWMTSDKIWQAGKTEEEKTLFNCILRGKFYVMDPDSIVIWGDRYTSTALMFENAQALNIHNKTVLRPGNNRYLYIEAYRFVDDLSDPKEDAYYFLSSSKTYKIKIRTYHYGDLLHPENVESIEHLQELNKDIFVDVAGRLPEDIAGVKIKVKVWSYMSWVGYSDNNFCSWKNCDWSEEYGLKLEDEYQVELERLLGYNRKRKCRNLR
ncbi:MAG: hypothetical protein JHC31_07305 [Sulfurihydrogenibium sp.]|nr:hypothetical protein [Sulfurihydrogenibium sp.]